MAQDEQKNGGLMKWFGVSWGAPMCEECPHVPPPVGELCSHCGETIFANESGVVYSNGPVAHRNCFFRGVSGSLAHVQKRCSCYLPGSEEGDPPGMTRRQAADQVAEYLEMNPVADEVICDFCSAREPLVLDVTAKRIIVAGYKSGAKITDSGVWGACAECARVIEAKDWQVLIERAVIGSRAIDPGANSEWERGYRVRVRVMVETVFGVKL